jgi:hypothetical protein
MKSEIENKANAQNAVEQNQNSAAPGAPVPDQAGSAPAPDPSGPSDSSDPTPSAVDLETMNHLEPIPSIPPTIQESINGPSPTWPLPRPGQRNRVGKVAQLPPDIREWLNLQLLDEVRYDAILDELDERGFGHITQQNITSWKACGGYNEWLSGHMARQERRSELETVCSLVAQSRGRLDEASLFLISSQLLNVVGDFDVASLKTHLAKDPQTYLRLIQTLTKLYKARQTSKNMTQTNLVHKPSSSTADGLDILPEAERGLTEETLKKITDAIHLF